MTREKAGGKEGEGIDRKLFCQLFTFFVYFFRGLDCIGQSFAYVTHCAVLLLQIFRKGVVSKPDLRNTSHSAELHLFLQCM
jgi:hypothetical protein